MEPLLPIPLLVMQAVAVTPGLSSPPHTPTTPFPFTTPHPYSPRHHPSLHLQEFLIEIHATRTINFVALSCILVEKSGSQDEFTRLTAIKWLKEFVEMASGQLVEQYPAILGVVLSNISHSNKDIQQVGGGGYDDTGGRGSGGEGGGRRGRGGQERGGGGERSGEGGLEVGSRPPTPKSPQTELLLWTWLWTTALGFRVLGPNSQVWEFPAY